MLLRKLDELLLSLLDGAPLTEERIYQLCDECLQTKLRQPLIRTLGEAFTTPAILARSFARKVGEQKSDEGGKTMGKFCQSNLSEKLKILFNRSIHKLRVCVGD